jgi:hypothetical protein
MATPQCPPTVTVQYPLQLWLQFICADFCQVTLQLQVQLSAFAHDCVCSASSHASLVCAHCMCIRRSMTCPARRGPLCLPCFFLSSFGAAHMRRAGDDAPHRAWAQAAHRQPTHLFLPCLPLFWCAPGGGWRVAPGVDTGRLPRNRFACLAVSSPLLCCAHAPGRGRRVAPGVGRGHPQRDRAPAERGLGAPHERLQQQHACQVSCAPVHTVILRSMHHGGSGKWAYLKY